MDTFSTFIGGAGKYLGIRGMSRVTSMFDPKTGFNETQWEDEYWIEKQVDFGTLR